MSHLPRAILIDGLAGTGKTTLARRLSTSHGYDCLDSGMLYRAAAWRDLRDPRTDRGRLLADVVVRPGREPDQTQGVLIDALWLGPELWGDAVGERVAEVASWPEVRRVVRQLCEDVIVEHRIAMTGRDTGALDADDAMRIELSCNATVRMARLAGRGGSSSKRDELESALLSRYLRSDERAIRIDTSSLSVDEVHAMVIRALQSSGCL
jgi:CMP/dCMP kinase